MMNNDDFEQLVYKKADKLKSHDRHMKMLRISVVPVAAAFVIMSLIGINSINLPSQMSSSENLIAEANRSNNANETYDKKSDSLQLDDEYQTPLNEVGELAEATSAYNAGEIDVEKSAENDVADHSQYVDSIASESVTFKANDTITITDQSAVDEICQSLSNPLSEYVGNASQFMCVIMINNTEYRIYHDKVKVLYNGSVSGEFDLSEDTKNVLQKYFPIVF